MKFDISKKGSKNKKPDMATEDFLAEIDETNYDIKKLIKKQSKNQLTSEEKNVLKKIFFMKNFKIKNSKDKDLFKEFYRKFNNKDVIIKRYGVMFGYNKKHSRLTEEDIKMIEEDDIIIDINEEDINVADNDDIDIIDDNDIIDDKDDINIVTDDEIDNFNDGKDKMREKIVINLLNILLERDEKQYNDDELIDIEFDEKEYERAIKRVSKKSMYFKDEEKYRSLFFKCPGKFIPLCANNKKHYISTIQLILSFYGIEFSRGKRFRKKDKLYYNYSLSVNKQIKNIVRVKYNKDNKVNGFENLFKK